MPDRHFELPAHPDLEYYRKQAKHLPRSADRQAQDITIETAAAARVAGPY